MLATSGRAAVPRDEVLDRRGGRRGAHVGHDLDLVLDELEPGVEPGQNDEEPSQQDEHEDHRGGGRQAHHGVPPEALPGPSQAERDERDHGRLVLTVVGGGLLVADDRGPPRGLRPACAAR